MVVCFDTTVDSDLVYNVNTDQFEYGRLLASPGGRMGGEGNILLDKGIEGNRVTLDRTEGMQSVLDNYPGIKVLGDGYGKWDDYTTASVMSNLMSAYASRGSTVSSPRAAAVTPSCSPWWKTASIPQRFPSPRARCSTPS